MKVDSEGINLIFTCENCRAELGDDHPDVESTIVGYFCSQKCLQEYALRENRCPKCLNELRFELVKEKYGEFHGFPAYKTFWKAYCSYCDYTSD